MRPTLLLFALSVLAPGQAQSPSMGSGFFPEIRKGVAPEERRALIIGKALWEAAAGPDYVKGMKRFSAHRVAEAWLIMVGTPESQNPPSAVDILDGASYMAFDSRDGGLFYANALQCPKDRDLIELLRRRRAVIKRGVE